MEQIFVGDVGTEIALYCGVDVSSATVRKIIGRKPTGARVEWDAIADGTTGIKYITKTDDLDVAGVWKLQAYVAMTGWSGKGAVAEISVVSGL